MTLPRIVNMRAFHAGYKAFFVGERKSYTFTTTQKLDVDRRLRALRHNNERMANALALKLTDQGIILVDIYEDANKSHPTDTIGEITSVASNPYEDTSYAAKEWDRGFNAAYFHNLKRKHK